MPTGARILVIDDDAQVRALLRRVLVADGYEVALLDDAPQAVDRLHEDHDLVLLDISLPSEDGRDTLARIREAGDLPVIMLTGIGEETDRIVGLKLGADDYVTKPFSPGELVARIESVLRRARRAPASAPARPADPPATAPPAAILDFGELTIDPATRDVVVAGRPVELKAKEFDLLAFLASSPRQVFSREQLLQHVWSSSSAWQDEGTVTEHVRRIRRRIEADPLAPRWVVTVRGVGYRFEP